MINVQAILTTYGPKIVFAILILLIGTWLIGFVNKTIEKSLVKAKVDDSLRPFLKSLTKVLLQILLVLAALSTLGLEVTSFVAILGAAGLAIGLALSGTLQNFAGGVIILIFKPFKVGHFIKAQGFAGTVEEIQIFNTTLTTLDNHIVIIPNGGLATGALENFSLKENRRIVLTFGIGYGDSVEKARGILNEIFAADERVFQTESEAPFIKLAELGDSSVNLTVRVWVKASDFWPVTFEINELVYNAFRAQGINIPFPQMDVHLHQEK